jgi:Ca2+/Na+ antiporter
MVRRPEICIMNNHNLDHEKNKDSSKQKLWNLLITFVTTAYLFRRSFSGFKGKLNIVGTMGLFALCFLVIYWFLSYVLLKRTKKEK